MNKSNDNTVKIAYTFKMSRKYSDGRVKKMSEVNRTTFNMMN